MTRVNLWGRVHKPVDGTTSNKFGRWIWTLKGKKFLCVGQSWTHWWPIGQCTTYKKGHTWGYQTWRKFKIFRNWSMINRMVYRPSHNTKLAFIVRALEKGWMKRPLYPWMGLHAPAYPTRWEDSQFLMKGNAIISANTNPKLCRLGDILGLNQTLKP